MPRWLTRPLNLKHYPGPVERRQAVAAYIIVGAGLLVSLAIVLMMLFAPPPETRQRGLMLAGGLAALAVFLLAGAAIARGRLAVARWLLLGVVFLVVFPPMLDGWSRPEQIVSVTLLITLAALLSNERGVLAVTLLTMVGIAAVMLSQREAVGAARAASMALGMALMTGVIGGLTYLLAQGWRRGLAHISEQSALRRTRTVQLSGHIAQRIFQRLTSGTLFAEMVELIRNNFAEIYHAQIFLLDETGRMAVLEASTGSVGRELLLRGHRLAVGSQSVVGQAAARGEPVLVSDTQADPVHRLNPLLPETRAELALPLLSGEQVVGVLDVQSQRPHAFGPDDIDALQTLASLAAVALDNARLFARQQAVIAENQQLVEQAQAQLAEIQALNRRLTRQVWEEYLGSQPVAPALTVDFGSGAMTPNASWTPGLSSAVEAGGAVIQETEAGRTLAVPIRIRGQAVGAMEFELEGEAPLQEGQMALVQEVVNRLALSLENARLVEQTQAFARREQRISAASARMQRASNLEALLKVAAEEFNAALGGSETRIRVQLEAPHEANGGSAPEGGAP